MQDRKLFVLEERMMSLSNIRFLVVPNYLSMRLITLLSLLFIFNGNIWGQNKDLKKANQLFKEDKYALAIPHYKKALTSKKNLSIKSKLAFCYKITNRIEDAVKLYEEIVTNERAKTKSYYYYAETLMSSGRYDEAKNWFSKYAIIELSLIHI